MQSINDVCLRITLNGRVKGEGFGYVIWWRNDTFKEKGVEVHLHIELLERLEEVGEVLWLLEPHAVVRCGRRESFAVRGVQRGRQLLPDSVLCRGEDGELGSSQDARCETLAVKSGPCISF
jgi:hypothetical protein